MNATIRNSLLSLVMLSWGVLLLYFFASDRLSKYLAPDFHTWVWIGGLGLCLIGTVNLLTAKHDEDCGHDHGPGDDHEHDHEAPNPLVAICIMIVPVAFSLSWTKDGEFSLEVLQRKGLQSAATDGSALFLASSLPPITKEVIESHHPANAEGYHEFSLLELFFATTDPEMRSLIGGMPVVVEGRLVPDGDSPPTQQRLYRLFMTCCAADSRAIPIVVRFDANKVPEVEENSWMTLSGTITYPDQGNGPEPVLEVDTANTTEIPVEESFMRGK